MGEASETTTTMIMNDDHPPPPPPKKKKGRPSLLDLQKRFLQQQQNPHFLNPSTAAAARSRNPNPNSGGGEDDDEDERAKKKHKLLLGINQNRKPTLHSDSNPDAGDDPDKISSVPRGSNPTSILKATDSSSIHGTQVVFGPTTPLPDKKLLVFILDRLQKKDTRGVFSEPVDPEELPDYHEIIEIPMDFGTVREKLDQGAYANLEQLEKDVFLISSNAMQYNAPDTIYFRQARSIQELAKKDFENLRQDNTGDAGGEVKPKVARRGRPPGSKTMKKSIDMAPVERLGSQYFSEMTLAPGGENSGLSNGYNLRKGPASYKFRTADILNKAPHGSLGGDTSANWLSELENEFPASVLRSVLKYGKKQFPVDENRRQTYRQSLASEHESSGLAGMEGEWNQLMAVSVAAEEHGYARSLARFAANLGPVAWKIASKRIGSVLPVGVEYGPGWVGENDSSRSQQFSFREGEDKVQFAPPASDDHKDRLRCQSTSGLNSVADRYSLQNSVNTENFREANSQNGPALLNSGISGIRSVPPFRNSMVHSGASSSANTPVPSHHQMAGMFTESIMNSQSMPIGNVDSNEAKPEMSSRPWNPFQAQPQLAYGGETSWQGLSMNNKQVTYSLPPDLNVEFGASGSPSSLIQIGMPPQPDLALQL
ncbi:uncharacterized protein LOC126794030 isoform X2 [Argentina anserina]|uniref:uncharacterized protein LOC126794030 isoform X2 n=1 Tax=Argentina anserina TaxID=57926 RepID=UPI0021767B95|nr:uncharacterized protein LOC126794030 isoform X2 [Potentilla anserina]